MKKENKVKNAETGNKEDLEPTEASPVALRGSGFSYDEDKEHTDKADSLNGDKADQAVKLPDLGKKNYP